MSGGGKERVGESNNVFAAEKLGDFTGGAGGSRLADETTVMSTDGSAARLGDKGTARLRDGGAARLGDNGTVRLRDEAMRLGDGGAVTLRDGAAARLTDACIPVLAAGDREFAGPGDSLLRLGDLGDELAVRRGEDTQTGAAGTARVSPIGAVNNSVADSAATDGESVVGCAGGSLGVSCGDRSEREDGDRSCLRGECKLAHPLHPDAPVPGRVVFSWAVGCSSAKDAAGMAAGSTLMSKSLSLSSSSLSLSSELEDSCFAARIGAGCCVVFRLLLLESFPAIDFWS